MEAQYSSDDDITCGPVSLKEIKAALKEPLIPKPSRRHTLNPSKLTSNSYKMKQSDGKASLLCQELKNNCNVSTTTEYYTPNESLSSNLNPCCYNKVQVSNEPDLQYNAKEHYTVPESKTKCHSPKQVLKCPDTVDIDETRINFIKAANERKTAFDIEQFQYTLVDNITLSSEDGCSPESDTSDMDKSVEPSNFNEIYMQEKLNETDPDHIIILSDDYDDDSIDIKSENSNLDSSYVSVSDEYKDVAQLSSQHDIQNASDLVEENNRDQMPEHSTGKAHKCVDDNIQEIISPITVPKIDIAQFDESIEFSQFNDTMEEIQKLLDQGCNVSSGSSNEHESSFENCIRPEITFSPMSIISASFSPKPESSRILCNTENITPLKTKSQIPKLTPVTENFKVPKPPSSQKGSTKQSTSKWSPGINTRPTKFNNIVSPVGLYIKYSPKPIFKQNLTPVESKLGGTPRPQICKSKENILNIPSVIYKPAKTQVKSAEKAKFLPPSLKNFVKAAQLTKHQGKTVQNANVDVVRRKLMSDPELTACSISDSLLSDSQDISVLKIKDAYM